MLPYIFENLCYYLSVIKVICGSGQDSRFWLGSSICSGVNKMNKTLVKFVFFLFLLSGFGSAHAELFVNPVTKNKIGTSEISAHFGSISVDYEVGGSSFDIDRTFLGATYAHGLNSSFDVFGTFSITLESEIENSPSDGDGFIIGGGIRGGIPNDLGVKLNGYGQLLLIDEDYGGNADGEEMAIMVGMAASKALDSKIKLYGALEFNLFSDMEIGSTDVDRDDYFGFRLGANFDLGQFLLNANMALIHETGIFISGSQRF
jgi:hypothetical protein